MTHPKVHTPGFLAIVNDAKTRITQIDIDRYRALVAAGEPHILVDVREDREWSEAHALGAVHLSKGTIERDIETKIPNPDERIVLYCGGGFRSALTADSIQKMGYRNVLSLDGGWRAIEASGLPVEKAGEQS